jgi:hypothetical protein
MKSYEIINNAYVNKVTNPSDLHEYLGTLWPLVKVK